MSNRSMLEFNHDFCPHTDEEKRRMAAGLVMFMSSGDPTWLPPGVTWFGTRHHSTPCPLGDPPAGWTNGK